MFGHLARKTSYAALGCAMLLNVTPTAIAQPPSLALRSRTIQFSSASTNEFVQQARSSPNGLHGYALLRRPPRAEDRSALAARGIVVLSRLARYNYIVRALRTAQFADTAVARRVAHFSVQRPSDRVNPAIWSGQYRSFFVRRDSIAPLNLVLNRDSTLTVIVQFHDDVPSTEAISVASAFTNTHALVSPGRWRLVISRADLSRLAANDAVRWVDAPPVGAVSDIENVRQRIRVNELQTLTGATVSGLTGAGITVGVYDLGIDKLSPDFNDAAGISRIVVSQNPSAHGTWVGGIIAGNGVNSTGSDSWMTPNNGTAAQWRGIAPSAKVIDSKKIESASSPTTSTLLSHITTNGMDLSNHSYSFDFDGAYGTLSKHHDDLIRGDATDGATAIPARLHVHSAGNFGQSPLISGIQYGNQHGYFSVAQLKNALVVGNFFDGANRIASISSLGPTYDGRIKPDVVAPATYVTTTGWCSTSDNPPSAAGQPCTKPDGSVADRSNFYVSTMGSSIGAAVATGMLTLVVEEIGKRRNLDTAAPLPSTLRAIAIHSASDLKNNPEITNKEGLKTKTFDGPDFVTGFGLVDAAAAVDVVRERRFREDILDATCSTKSYNFLVNPGDVGSTLKITIAWDDPASVAPEISSQNPRLVNDLDLVLIDPSGAKHYPWLLDQIAIDAAGLVISNEAQACDTPLAVKRALLPAENPVWIAESNPANVNDNFATSDLVAAGKGKDHLNNVEQVVTPAIPGAWRAEVSGFNIDQGPQRFSLIGIPFRIVLFEPRNFCRILPALCDLKIRPFCTGAPEICTAPSPMAVENNTIRLRFRGGTEPKIISLSSLCFALFESDTCGQSPGRELIVGPGVDALTVELFGANGSRLARDASGQGTKRIRIPRGSGNSYLVIEPRNRVSAQVDYVIPIALRR